MVVGMYARGAEQGIAMPVMKRKSGRWCFREVVRLPNGKRERIFGTAPLTNNTKARATQLLHEAIEAKRNPKAPAPMRAAITFADWFNGRFWEEWVVGQKNKPTEQRSKRSIYSTHLGPALGHLALAEIDVGEVARFRASLVRRGLSDKRINNILSVLSKALNYAEDVKLITAPKVGLLKVERPAIVAYELDELARVLAAARAHSPMAYVAVLLACDASLRVGEIKALRWKEDVDLLGRAVTINQQVCDGEFTTPKGLTRRTVPMTDRLFAALKGLEVVRTGLVVRDRHGEPLTDSTADKLMRRHLLPGTGLDLDGWHVLRHTFATDAARFGVHSWVLQRWMGHKKIEETERYVHLVTDRPRPIPADVLAAGAAIADPNERAIVMLGIRGTGVALSAVEAG
jgi:integrase